MDKMYATYNLEDNKIRIYSGRVERDLYDRLRAARYQRAYKQGCFYATWNPNAEDIALELCGEIEDDGISLEERAAERAERYEGYSENAGQRSRDARARAKAVSDRIPFGQPILVGHHSERSARADQKRIEQGWATSYKEWRKSEYWQERSEASLRHARRMKDPGVVHRRIKKLRASLAKHKRNLTVQPHTARWAINSFCEKRWGEPAHRLDLTDEQQAEVDAEIENLRERQRAHHERWIAHLEMRLEFEEELYAASGGIPADNLTLEKGGFVQARSGWLGPIIRVNKSKGHIVSVSVPSEYSWTDKIPVDGIKNALTAMEAETQGMTQP